MRVLDKTCGIGAAVLVGLVLTPAVTADTTFIYSGTASGGQSADANFIFSSSGGVTTLSIQLISTTAQPYTGGAGNQHLTGLFFDLAGINSSSFSYNGLVSDPAFNNLIENDFTDWTTDSTTADQYWGFNDMTSDTSASSLLSSTGGQEFALFAAGFFDLPDIGSLLVSGAEPIDGADGGIINFAEASGTPEPKIEDGLWVSFDLGAYAFDENSLSNIFFQWGTDSSQPGTPGTLIPLPPAVAMGLQLRPRQMQS